MKRFVKALHDLRNPKHELQVLHMPVFTATHTLVPILYCCGFCHHAPLQLPSFVDTCWVSLLGSVMSWPTASSSYPAFCLRVFIANAVAIF
jgi:hypothetical protein